MKKLFKALAVLSSFSVLTRALGFVFRIFLSRLVGAEGLGVYQIAFSVFMVFETFISSGLPLAVSKKTSALISKGKSKVVPKMVTTALVVGVGTSILLCLVVFVLRGLFSTLFTDARCIAILLVLMPTLVFSSVYCVLRGALWGQKKYFFVSLTEFVEQVVRVIVAVVFLAGLSFSLEKVFLASISYVISCIASSLLVVLIYFKTGGRMLSPNKDEAKSLIKSSVPITLVRVVSSLLTPLISIIIPFKLVGIGFSNDQALAMLGVAMGMTFPLLYVPSTLISSLSMTIIPDLSSAVSTQSFDKIKNQINFSIKFAIFVAFLFVPLYFSLGKPIGMFFYGNIESGQYLCQSAMLILPICLSSVTVSCLNALDLETKGFVNYVFGAIFLIVCILFLTNFFGVMSLAIGMFACLGVASVLNIIMLGKKLGESFFNLKYLFCAIVCSLPCALMSKWTFNILSSKLSLFASLALSSIVGALFYAIFGLVFNLFSLSFLNQKKEKQLATK